MWEWAEIAVCDWCGHRWLPDSGVPKRCAKCKKVTWNKSNRGKYAIPGLAPKVQFKVAEEQGHAACCRIYGCLQCKELGVVDRTRGLV